MAGIWVDGEESPQNRVISEFFLVFLGRPQNLMTVGGEKWEMKMTMLLVWGKDMSN